MSEISTAAVIDSLCLFLCSRVGLSFIVCVLEILCKHQRLTDLISASWDHGMVECQEDTGYHINNKQLRLIQFMNVFLCISSILHDSSDASCVNFPFCDSALLNCVVIQYMTMKTSKYKRQQLIQQLSLHPTICSQFWQSKPLWNFKRDPDMDIAS